MVSVTDRHSGTLNTVTDIATRRLAWDGVSFDVPHDWELAGYRFLKHGITHIDVEDDFSMRLEAEWIRPDEGLSMQQLVPRYEKISRKLTLQSDDERTLTGLPAGWSATLHLFRDDTIGGHSPDGIRKRMITAFYVGPRASIFAFLLLHFGAEDLEQPEAVMAHVAGGFTQQSDGPTIRWQLFDIGFDMPREFKLESTEFDVGSKMMTFRREQRRLLLWHFSCADRILARNSHMEAWAAGYLNGFSNLKGPIFEPGSSGRVETRRRKKYLFGHRDELVRRCMKYLARCRQDHERNQLVAWVFQYRKDADLAMLPHWLET